MDRRSLLTSGVALAATGFAAFAPAAGLPSSGPPPRGPVTLYLEFRVAPPENAAVLAGLRTLGSRWAREPGFLHLSLKQMVGDSTMVKNYPESYKGVLATAYLDGLKAQRQPYFYALFVRFADYAALRASGADTGFAREIGPHLHAFSVSPHGPARSEAPMAWYQGVFETIAAGNRSALPRDAQAIAAFLRAPADAPDLVTVANHVSIREAGRAQFDRDVGALLEVAQQTYQPSDAANGIGEPGARDNRLYRKAVSTEILRNAFPDGDLRAYLMHGVWDSVWDHENSHLDPRFQEAAGPVGAAVAIGPIEPFYRTSLSIGAA
jgi:hypothetical protein